MLDVGAGTGVLSLFAAKCGAAKVIAIEAGDMAHIIGMLAEANKVGHIIHVINKRVEDIECLPFGIEKVDVIISEWYSVVMSFLSSNYNTILNKISLDVS